MTFADNNICSCLIRLLSFSSFSFSDNRCVVVSTSMTLSEEADEEVEEGEEEEEEEEEPGDD